MNKIKIIITILCCLPVLVSAQKNRYGMTIKKTEEGCTVERYDELSKLVDLSKLTDLCVRYKYVANKIKPEDYEGCTTNSYVFKDYGTYQLKMEVDLPKEGKGPFPFIIYVHGGGWAGGSLESYADQSKYAATRGIAGVRISYTLKKRQGTFDQGMLELDEALQFVKKHATEWNLDLNRIGYAGGSAGSPLASLAAMKNKAKLFIGCNGIYSFVDEREGGFPGENNSYLRNHKTADKLKEISSYYHIPKKNPPAVITFHGNADATISYKQAIMLCDAIKKAGGKAEAKTYPNYTHAFYAKNSSDKFEEIMIEMYRFANEVFNGK